ncbi:MAG: hypothetical protein ABI036_13275 [Fibrobacteria bacterium]
MNKILFCLLSAAVLGRAEDTATSTVTDRKISVAAFIDVGQLVKGAYVEDEGAGTPEEQRGLFMNRDGIALIYSGTMHDNLHMTIGVGGLFWKPFLEKKDEPQTKKINFGPGIAEASTQYDFNSDLTLKFGYFGYKYNPDASNLGEYLLRSEAYPTLLANGSGNGWVWLGNEYKNLGVKLSWDMLGGALRNDFLIFSDFYSNPVFDMSPSYVATFKIGKALELGAGVNFRHFIPIKPSATTPKADKSTYVEIPGFPAYPAIDSTQGAFAGGTLKAMKNQVTQFTEADAATAVVSAVKDAEGKTVYVRADNGDTLRPSVETPLTFKAIELMGRFSLNLGSLFGMEEAATGPFKVFAEAALLGVQNQPYYFDKRSERIPIMMGVNIPAFGLLDLVSVQAEYFKNPWPDNNFNVFHDGLPVPDLPPTALGNSGPGLYQSRKASGFYDKDDLKWSILLQRTLVPGWVMNLQVANDHFRGQDQYAQASSLPVTQEKSDWYYLLRFAWSM